MIEGQPLIDFGWIAGHFDSIVQRIVQHLQLTILPLVIGIVISLILAVWAVRQPRAYGPVTAITGLLYTILFRSFAAGFSAVPAEILEAAEGMGYTRRQRLLRVELPLAVPLMIAGVRLASVTTIGLATIAAVLGDTFGGLGQLITEGIQNFFPTKYLLGAALSVVLAFAADYLFVRFERLVTPWARARAGGR